MIKRPKPNETEEDILRMQEEFLSQKAKNPKMQPAAEAVKMNRAPKKSLFAKSRQNIKATEPDAMVIDKQPQQHSEYVETNRQADVILGDIVERKFMTPKQIASNSDDNADVIGAFPVVDKIPIQRISHLKAGKSIFALSMSTRRGGAECENVNRDIVLPKPEPMQHEPTDDNTHDLNQIYGFSSAIVEDTQTAAKVHEDNINLLKNMKVEQILAERKRLLDSIDPSLVALLAKRRKEKADSIHSIHKNDTNSMQTTHGVEQMEIENKDDIALKSVQELSKPAVDMLQRSTAEKWIHFDVVEKDKLEWMQDVSLHANKLKKGEKFEARFDWKGVLLPYSIDLPSEMDTQKTGAKDERELYLHGEDPHRPGYTLQELFRLARSNIMQQRVSAFGAIAGILNIYNQGFYDQVLELPISKIFFLLRFGFDDNTPAMLEVVSKALAYLFYNETDEALLDFIYENPGCHWQPILKVLSTDLNNEADDPTSVENLQKQMQQLQMNASSNTTIQANVAESEEESKTSMSDFQLAETDLIDCLLRSNALQRIYYILHTIRPENSTVSSCFKILIRIARSGKDAAMQIVNNESLIQCLFENFLPGMERIDTTLPHAASTFYNYPQYLCLKLVRVLICQNLTIAIRFMNLNIVDILQNYIFNREDIKSKLIKLQIESLRILRCLLLLRVDNGVGLYKKFLPAFRYLLEWHFNHVIFEVGGPFLIRQHAAVLLSVISSGNNVGLEVQSMLGELLHDCCCSWFYKATRGATAAGGGGGGGVQEFSQATLLSACLNVVTWSIRNGDAERFRKFNEKYLLDFVTSECFMHFLHTLDQSSIILRNDIVDRRNIHSPLPNVGSVLLHKYGPQLIVSQTYPIYMLTALWRLLELQLERDQHTLFEHLIQPKIIEPLVQYLHKFARNSNRCLATNFYAKMEVKFLFKLLCFDGLNGAYFEKAERMQMAYELLCCLTAEHIPEVEQLFERVIFHPDFMNVNEKTLNKWRKTCLELVYSHYIVVSPTELTLSMMFSQAPILPSDWPYFQLKTILQNYIDNVQHNTTSEIFSEYDVLNMTFNFVARLEECNPKLEIVTPTEKLMYLMIAFMGTDSQFLKNDIHELLHNNLLNFYKQCNNYTFQFDALYEGKCKFENLYALFVDHFQAASYGDELFGSLLLVPLAQKYNNKWRRRVWSDYAAALRFLNCDDQLLIGGLQAYLEPPEDEESLIRAYNTALNTNLVRPNTIPYKIAKHHVDLFRERLNKL